MSHGLARGGREARDVAHHRLGDVLGDVVGGAFLLVAADLAAHDDQLGLVVTFEQRDDVDERRAHDRVPADPDDGGVAEPALGQLVADLIGQRARPRDDPDVALGEEVGGDDSHVGLARRQDPRAVGADQPGRAAAQVGMDAQHVVRGDAFGDRDDERDAGVLGLEDRVGGKARRNEHHGGVGAGGVDRRMNGVEHRHPVDVLATLSRGDAGDDVRAVSAVVGGMEGALPAGQAGDHVPGVGPDEDAHAVVRSRSDASATTSAAAPSMVCSTWTLGSSASASSRRPSLSLVPSSRTTNGTSGLTSAKASMSPRATSSQRVMPPKMLNRTALTFGSERITSTALTIASALEPPPASRKFAGLPPAWATTSSVDMTRPAPLPRMPMSPSSLT